MDHPIQPSSSNNNKKGVKAKITTNNIGSSSSNSNGNSNIQNNGNVGSIVGDRDENDEDVLVISTEEAVGDNSNMIYIIMGCSLGLIIILIALASGAIAYVRTRKVANNTAESSGFLHM